MTKYIDEDTMVLISNRLRDIFRHAGEENINDTTKPLPWLRTVIENMNIVDTTQDENSPMRNKPLFMHLCEDGNIDPKTGQKIERVMSKKGWKNYP